MKEGMRTSVEGILLVNIVIRVITISILVDIVEKANNSCEK